MKKYLLIVCIVLLFGCGGDDTTVSVIDSGIQTDSKVESKKDSSTSDTFITETNIDDTFGTSDADLTDVTFDLWKPSPGAIAYHGGHVMTNPINVYIIWYGDWIKDNKTVSVVEYLFSNIGDSDYFKTNSSYYELPTSEITDSGMKPDQGVFFDPAIKTFVNMKVNFIKSVYVGYPYGLNLNDENISAVVADTFVSGLLPSDIDGIYYVLTSKDVYQNETTWIGFCSGYCGWHDIKLIDGKNIKYSFVGDIEKCPADCAVKDSYLKLGYANSPNDDWSADEMASILIHELSETATDPNWSKPYVAWQDDNGMENEDKCAWTYGSLYKTSSGSVANVKVGSKDFLIQQNWVLDSDGGHCALKQ